jgi:hypothetical protein
LYDPEISAFLETVEQAEQVTKVDRTSLHLFSFFSDLFGQRNAFREFLAGFLTTEARSGPCILNGQHYSTAAQQCLKYLHEDSTAINNPLLKAWAQKCLPTLLNQSIKTDALVQAAQCTILNPTFGDISAPESMAKAAIERYLSLCTESSF